MEKEEMKGLSDEELQQRIGSLLEAMRREQPEELERLKGIIRKSVPFFTRSAFSAYLLMLAAEGRKAPERKGERRARPDRPEIPSRTPFFFSSAGSGKAGRGVSERKPSFPFS